VKKQKSEEVTKQRGEEEKMKGVRKIRTNDFNRYRNAEINAHFAKENLPNVVAWCDT
jgi:hypothetical protein